MLNRNIKIIFLLIIFSLFSSSNSQCTGKPKFNCKYVCNGIDFLVEGLEKSDYGLSLPTSDYQRGRPANGFINCNPNSTKATLVNVFYDSQKYPSVYETEAIRVLCNASGGMKNFCVCDENGDCYTPVKNNVPVYAELATYCDQYEENDPSKVFVQKFSPGFACGTNYMKISAVSCNGCKRIKKAVNEKICEGYFVPNKLNVQNIKKILTS